MHGWKSLEVNEKMVEPIKIQSVLFQIDVNV